MSLHKEDQKLLRKLRRAGILTFMRNGRPPRGVVVACNDDPKVARLLAKHGTFRPSQSEFITVKGGASNQLPRADMREPLLRHIRESLAALETRELYLMSDFPCPLKRYWYLLDVVRLMVRAKDRLERAFPGVKTSLLLNIAHGSRTHTYAVAADKWRESGSA